MTGRTGVTVVGSVHMDLIATAANMPQLGTSVIGASFTQSPGGKAGNQAAQLARLGVPTWLVSRVGADGLGDQITSQLRRAGIRLDYLPRDAVELTGTSTVFEIGGEYASIIVPGAAALLSGADLDRAAPAFARSRFTVAQLELGTEIADEAFRRARAHGSSTVLNASPLSSGGCESLAPVLRETDILVVNRHEASKLAELPVPDRSTAGEVARDLGIRFEIPVTVVTCGSEGAVLARDGDLVRVDAFPVVVVDSVGAGDAFLGGLIASWVDDQDDATALRFASAAGAIAASGSGAFASLPDRPAIEAFLLAQR